MSKTVISAQHKAIKELKQAIETFVNGHNKTRVIPLAIPTGWGKTRIAIQGVLKAFKGVYPIPVSVVIWPQKHSHISEEVWLRCTDWCRKRNRSKCSFESCKHEMPQISYLHSSKKGPKMKRHEIGAGTHNKGFKGTFYSVNNKFTGIKNELDRTNGPILFIIDEWHSKNMLEKYEEYKLDAKKVLEKKEEYKLAENFWRDKLIGKESTRKLFVLLVSATPIGATSHMDSINADESEGKFKKDITNALESFSKLTIIGNQRRKYNLYNIYPDIIKSEERKLKYKQDQCQYRYSDYKGKWIINYIDLSKKAYGNRKKAPSPASLIYSLESLLNSGVPYDVVKRHHKKSLAAYFNRGFSKQKQTLKLLTIGKLLRKYSDQKFVVFCHHIAVAHSLNKYLKRINIPSYYLAGDVKKRDDKFNSFNDENNDENEKIRVLIVTDEHSQGVSLHKSKAWLIHFELSWNPIRIIQRYGRVWRIDKKSRKLTTPLAFYIPHSFSSEEEMISRLKRRWNVLKEISNSKEANFVNLSPISFEVALGKRCSPPVVEET